MAYLSPDHKTREQQPSASDRNWKKRHPDTLFWVLQRNRTSRCKCILISSAQSLSRVWLFSTPWTAARQASLSITSSWSTFKLMSVASVMLSNQLILCCPLLLPPSIFPGIRVFSSELVLCIRWSKYWSFSFSISPSNEYAGLISFRIDWLKLLAVHAKGFIIMNWLTWLWRLTNTKIYN